MPEPQTLKQTKQRVKQNYIFTNIAIFSKLIWKSFSKKSEMRASPSVAREPIGGQRACEGFLKHLQAKACGKWFLSSGVYWLINPCLLRWSELRNILKKLKRCMSFSMSSIAASYEPNQRFDTFWKGLHELRNIFEKLKLCMGFSMSSIAALWSSLSLSQALWRTLLSLNKMCLVLFWSLQEVWGATLPCCDGCNSVRV